MKADVRAPFVITSVTAEVGGISVPMTKIPGYWVATPNIGALPLGPLTMTITAVDANGDTTTASKALLHDHSPTLTVATPTEIVASPAILLRATCSKADAYGCASVRASIGNQVLASGGSSLDQTVSLAAWEGKTVAVRFDAVDTAGLVTTQTIRAYVETSPNLLKVDEVDGPILDADPTRLLYVGPLGAAIKDRATGVETVLSSARPTKGHLLSSGAFLSDDITFAGDWRVSFTPGTVLRENLVTGTSEVIYAATVTGTHWPTQTKVVGAGIDAGGNVFLATFADGAYLVRSGDSTRGTRICNEARLPLVDGERVVYMRMASTPGLREIFLGTASGSAEVKLDRAGTTSSRVTSPLVDYRIAGGWVAHTKSVAGTALEVWTRSPTGEHRLASPYSDATLALAGLNDSGEVVVDHTAGRAISAAGMPSLAIGGASGLMRYFGGAWHELKGRVLFRVAPGAGGPATNPVGGGAGAAGDPPAPGPGAVAPGGADRGAADRGGARPPVAGADATAGVSCAIGGGAGRCELAAFFLALAAAGALRRQRRC